MAEEASRRIDPLAAHGLRALDALEQEGGEFADSRALEGYRERRIAELKAKAARNRFGELRALAREDFVAEVSEASKQAWVVVFLHQSHVPDSQLLARVVAPLAARHAAVKFLSIKADACIENYPDRNVPTLLLYHNGSLQGQVVGLAELGGPRVSENSKWGASPDAARDGGGPFRDGGPRGGSARRGKEGTRTKLLSYFLPPYGR